MGYKLVVDAIKAYFVSKFSLSLKGKWSSGLNKETSGEEIPAMY
jgi:hypothetical protein